MFFDLFEVIVLNFNDYEKNVKEFIVNRGKIDEEIAQEEEEEEPSSKVEIEINDNYIFEI